MQMSKFFIVVLLVALCQSAAIRNKYKNAEKISKRANLAASAALFEGIPAPPAASGEKKPLSQKAGALFREHYQEKAAAKPEGTTFEKVKLGAADAFSWMKSKAEDAFSWIKPKAESAYRWAKPRVQSAFGWISAKFHDLLAYMGLSGSSSSKETVTPPRVSHAETPLQVSHSEMPRNGFEVASYNEVPIESWSPPAPTAGFAVDTASTAGHLSEGEDEMKTASPQAPAAGSDKPGFFQLKVQAMNHRGQGLAGATAYVYDGKNAMAELVGRSEPTEKDGYTTVMCPTKAYIKVSHPDFTDVWERAFDLEDNCWGITDACEIGAVLNAF